MIFPHQPEDYKLIYNFNFNSIRQDVISRIENFDSLAKGNYFKSINNIFKKILLENNNSDSDKMNRLLFVSDYSNQKIVYEQKYLHLLKRGNMICDCLHINSTTNVINKIIERVSFSFFALIWMGCTAKLKTLKKWNKLWM